MSRCMGCNCEVGEAGLGFQCSLCPCHEDVTKLPSWSPPQPQPPPVVFPGPTLLAEYHQPGQPYGPIWPNSQEAYQPPQSTYQQANFTREEADTFAAYVDLAALLDRPDAVNINGPALLANVANQPHHHQQPADLLGVAPIPVEPPRPVAIPSRAAILGLGAVPPPFFPNLANNYQPPPPPQPPPAQKRGRGRPLGAKNRPKEEIEWYKARKAKRQREKQEALEDQAARRAREKAATADGGLPAPAGRIPTPEDEMPAPVVPAAAAALPVEAVKNPAPLLPSPPLEGGVPIYNPGVEDTEEFLWMLENVD